MRSSPRRIALGVSLGVLIAFSPTIGFQMGLALVAAWIFNASRIAAVSCVWISNPLTIGPVFAFTYAVGRPFWYASPEVGFSQLSRAIGGGLGPSSIGSVFSAFHSIYSLGTGVFMPMLIGGLITGFVAGGLCFFPAKSIASYCHKLLRRRSRTSRRGGPRGVKLIVRQNIRPVEVLHAGNHPTPTQRRAA